MAKIEATRERLAREIVNHISGDDALEPDFAAALPKLLILGLLGSVKRAPVAPPVRTPPFCWRCHRHHS